MYLSEISCGGFPRASSPLVISQPPFPFLVLYKNYSSLPNKEESNNSSGRFKSEIS